jgi:glycosyltransferase involved in cell wall biosynthesis
MTSTDQWVLQLCHGYDGPFLDCARQYAVLFEGSGYKVTTVYLTGAPNGEVERGSASDEVVFLGYDSAEMRSLKLGAIRALKRLVKGRDFRLCIAHRFKPTYISLLATKLPVIAVNHAFGVYRRRSRRLVANLFRRRLALLGVSDAVRDDICRCLPGWPPERIQTLYNRIDAEALRAEQLNRVSARAQLGLPADAWILGNVGRLHPDKDQATLIRGFAKALPNLPAGSLLVIMGKGRLEAPLKKLAIELGVALQVCFLGQVPHARRYFKALDAFALTSDHEPFGMVLLEAMAAGVPVICSDCGGGPEVVGDSGLMFPLHDDQALAQRMEQIAQLDEAALASCRAAMRARLEVSFSDQAARMLFWSQHFAPVRNVCSLVAP